MCITLLPYSSTAAVTADLILGSPPLLVAFVENSRSTRRDELLCKLPLCNPTGCYFIQPEITLLIYLTVRVNFRPSLVARQSANRHESSSILSTNKVHFTDRTSRRTDVWTSSQFRAPIKIIIPYFQP